MSFLETAEASWKSRRKDSIERENSIRSMEAYFPLDDEKLAIYHLMVALHRFYQGAYEDAKINIEIALPHLINSTEKVWYLRLLYAYGLILSTSGLLAESLKFWKEGLEISRFLNESEIRVYLLYNLADMNRAIMHRFEIAKNYYLEGLALIEGNQLSHPLHGPLKMGFARYAMAKGDIENALFYANEAISIARLSNDERALSLCLEFAASRYLESGQSDQAYILCNESLLIREKNQDLYGLANGNMALADILLEKNQLESALECINKTFQYLNQIHSTAILDVAYKSKGKILEKLGNNKDALECYKNYIGLKEANMSVSLENQLNLLSAEMEMEKTKRDLEIHRLKNIELEDRNKQIENLALELEAMILDLKETQEKLIRAEKLGALMNLVSGVAHKMNTPLGNAITLTSFLKEKTNEIITNFELKQLTKSQFESYFSESTSGYHSLEKNLGLLAKIVQSFKRLGLQLTPHSNECILASNAINQWKNHFESFYNLPQNAIQLKIESDKIISISQDMINQIFDELAINALIHGYDFDFERIQSKSIDYERLNLPFLQIETTYDEREHFLILLSDFGNGCSKENLSLVRRPFFTTNPTHLGLGLHLVDSIVHLLANGEFLILSPPLGFKVSIKI